MLEIGVKRVFYIKGGFLLSLLRNKKGCYKVFYLFIFITWVFKMFFWFKEVLFLWREVLGLIGGYKSILRF